MSQTPHGHPRLSASKAIWSAVLAGAAFGTSERKDHSPATLLAAFGVRTTPPPDDACETVSAGVRTVSLSSEPTLAVSVSSPSDAVAYASAIMVLVEAASLSSVTALSHES